MNDGLKIEPAAAVLARDMFTQHLHNFSFVIRKHQRVSQAVVASYVDGLAGVMALAVVGGHGSRDDVFNATVAKLREAFDRDLQHLAGL